MLRTIVLSGAILAFGSLCYWCLHSHSFEIQQDVAGRVQQTLAGNRIPSQNMTVDGRDVVLSGIAGSHEIAADTQKLVAGVEGVRTVEARVIPAADTAPDAKAAALTTGTQGKIDSLLAQDVVEFDPASAQLTPHGRAVLDQIAPMLAASPALFCEIQGHTDSAGDPNANKALSYRRALETKNYLVNQGIAPERLEPKAYGDTQPIASNQTAAGRRKNRRINFVLKEKA
jgi:outer membrane protein OmpA-like peptidoglycan-associated protein